ncbi:hypothetical protein AYR62_14700 [Secundilactobacillus paracollinoides]|uniref:HTH tetR-type domain-containing protein n=2 Tax=Secundilactobacillus paracollinoides TaxID=240427 RepID=A0A1B2IXE3_9LACO|nr:TetR/AcrR family transcriptional regulator [Secundilactobacillus paracollinoides]ANZ65205.1 hypothetical protein AYR62_14700 [Secundilactobacillus paracollinoides]ANZ66678.1 hypothetical protein AYR63_05690 [Secundilactobacillus paracollinoides]
MLKKNHTRRELQKAMLALLTSKPFANITVNDLVKQSHLNRSTFYRCYDDKYDLIRSVEDDFIAKFMVFRKQFGIFNLENDALEAKFEFCRAHAVTIRTLLSVNGDPRFERRLRQEIDRAVDAKFQLKMKNDLDIMAANFAKSSLSGAVMYTIGFIASNPDPKLVVPLEQNMKRLILNGLWQILEEISDPDKEKNPDTK